MFLYYDDAPHILGKYRVSYKYGDFVPQSEMGTNKLGGVRMQLTPNEFLFSIEYYKIVPIEYRVLPGVKLGIPHDRMLGFELKEIPDATVIQRVRGVPKNIMEFEYIGANDRYCFARFEMLQFILPGKNHAECERLVHLMKANGIFNKFRKPDPPAASQPFSVADELMKLNNLVNAGIITPAEFDSQKRRLLGQ